MIVPDSCMRGYENPVAQVSELLEMDQGDAMGVQV